MRISPAAPERAITTLEERAITTLDAFEDEGRASERGVSLPGVDLDLAPEHALLRNTVREFMTEEVAPVVDEHERARRFPGDVVARLGEMGWLGIPVPERWGGAGMDTLAYAIAIEEIGRVWGSLGLIVAAHTSLGCGPLLLAGSDDQKERFLVPMASGQVIGAYGLTEPGAGSDRPTASSRMKTTRSSAPQRRAKAFAATCRPPRSTSATAALSAATVSSSPSTASPAAARPSPCNCESR